MPLSVPTYETLAKQPGENKLFYFDFGAELVSSVTITPTAIQIDPQGVVANTTPLTYSALTTNDQVAQAILSGGTDGETYRVECTATTSDGQSLKCGGYLAVASTKAG